MGAVRDGGPRDWVWETRDSLENSKCLMWGWSGRAERMDRGVDVGD